MDWRLIGHYNDAESKAQRRDYKAGLALLPTVDHVGDGLGEAVFRTKVMERVARIVSLKPPEEVGV